MPKKKTAAKRKARTTGAPNKSAYVRSLPADMPAKDVVEKAKAQGMKLSVEYVYSIRAAAKTTARKSAKAGAPKRLGRPPKVRATSDARSRNVRVEDLLRAAAAEIGLSHAIGLLQAEQQKVRSVIGG
jgi:hypothetical protein